MVQKRPVGQWTWEELTVKSMAELRLLAQRTDLGSRVLRLTLALRVSAPEYQEAEALLAKLEGSEATHARVGVLELDRAALSLDLTDVSALTAGLPDVLRKTVEKLRREAENPETREAAERALFHLFTLTQGAPKKAS
jgi:hypothetical protein